jgi:hypothetical protein
LTQLVAKSTGQRADELIIVSFKSSRGVVTKFAILYEKVKKVRNLTLHTGIKRCVSNEYTTDNGDETQRTGIAKRRLYRSVTKRPRLSDPEPVITK